MKSALWWHQVPAKQTQSELVLLEPGDPIQIGQSATPRERIDVTFATLTDELLRDIQKKNWLVQLRYRRTDDDSGIFRETSEEDATDEQWFTYAYLTASAPSSKVRIGLPSGSYEFEYRVVLSDGRVKTDHKEGHGVYITFLYSGMTMKNV
ncbi:hypothetical protein XU18_0833 [Perkinsela sp. CCAP 1560/4]|nr:hypothetical protein XU18_0833 [Perkinsela sp. CCAP 1560/4]|eukprot:KNH08713.1 hypothetical protein XU18_0833 [Perkinsela sp. CCAP 1560/4]